MKKIVTNCIIIALVLIFSCGVSILFCGAGLWALCKLGIIASWTWKQATLWAIVIEIAIVFLKSIFGNTKEKK